MSGLDTALAQSERLQRQPRIYTFKSLQNEKDF